MFLVLTICFTVCFWVFLKDKKQRKFDNLEKIRTSSGADILVTLTEKETVKILFD